jgi:hypothetical protein
VIERLGLKREFFTQNLKTCKTAAMSTGKYRKRHRVKSMFAGTQ